MSMSVMLTRASVHARAYAFALEKLAGVELEKMVPPRLSEKALPGELEVVHGAPDGARIDEQQGASAAFTTDYAPAEIFEMAAKLQKKM